MSTVLVIPAGASASDASWIERDGKAWTWAEVAADNGCDRCEPLDGAWCTDRAVDGLGIREDAPPPEPAPDPEPQEPAADPVQDKLDTLEEKLNAILAKLGG